MNISDSFLEPEYPPYEIIMAAEELDFKRPADLPWIKIPGERRIYRCGCLDKDHELIIMHLCKFLDLDYDIPLHYWIGQCPRCRSLFWSAE